MGCKNSVEGNHQKQLLDEYVLGEELGQGAYGTVYMCWNRETKREFAVKMIDKVETPLDQIQREVLMLEKLKHPNVVKLHDVFFEKLFVNMVMDILRGGDMITGMQKHWKSKGMIPCNKIPNVCRQMASSISFLHSKNVVHRDVKGDNFLLDREDLVDPDCKIYLADFGTVTEMKPGERLSTNCGTMLYWAPELYKMNYGLKVDIWALGVVSHGLVTGGFPFKNERDVLTRKLKLPSRCPPEGQDFVKSLLTREEEERLDGPAVLAHPFLMQTASVAPVNSEDAASENVPLAVRESGANANVDERRRQLVGRLERVEKRKGRTKKDLKIFMPRFEVVDEREKRIQVFEWWSAQKFKERNLVDTNLAKKVPVLPPTTKPEMIRDLLEKHQISTAGFGKGKARTLDQFTLEVEHGASLLLLDASKYKSMVRQVNIVILRLSYGQGLKKKYLLQVSEEYGDGRVRDLVVLPGTKKEPHENSMQVADRIVTERLQLSDCKIAFNYKATESYEDEELSPSYPGVRTVYIKQIVEGEITTSDARVKERIASGTGFRSEDSKGVTRSYQWCSEAECQNYGVKMRALAEGMEVSALVQAPIWYSEEKLTRFMETNNIPPGGEVAKRLTAELLRGEAHFEDQPDGTIIRVCDIVALAITNKRTGEVLVEASETVHGKTVNLEWLPACRRRPDENQFLTAKKLLLDVLGFEENSVVLDPNDVLSMEETKESITIPGLMCKYRKRIIFAAFIDTK
mmetsp:Transcript_50428/g.141101  ORF Transcript_50428/g.141101 Transcript_50428/m.141101 type:complete len:744 (-) Transcript_50428:184-2415(-)